MKGDEDKVIEKFREALHEEGWKTELGPSDGFDVLATRPDGSRLYVEAKGAAGADSGTAIDILYGQLLRRMTDNGTDPLIRYAAVVRDDPQGVHAVERVPARIRKLLRIDVFAVPENGPLRRLP